MANAKRIEAEGIVGGVEAAEEKAKGKKRLSRTEAAVRQRAYRDQKDKAKDIPPVPTNITPAQLREAVRETGELLTKALTWATEQGVGKSQESKNLSLAAKTCSSIWQTLNDLPGFTTAERVCNCAKCVAWTDPKSQAAPFGNLAENAWRAVHLARIALPASKGAHAFHGSAKEWIYTLGNCVEEAEKACKALRGDGPAMTPMQVYMHVHRAEIMKPDGLFDMLAVAAKELDKRRPRVKPVVAVVPIAQSGPRPLTTSELADLGV